MTVAEVELVLQFPNSHEDSRVGRFDMVSGQERVAGFKARVLEAEGVDPSPRANVALFFNGVELQDDATLEQCGIKAATGTERWADGLLYGNGWCLMAHLRPTPLTSGECWPPGRQLMWRDAIRVAHLGYSRLAKLLTPSLLLTLSVVAVSLVLKPDT